MKVIVSWGCKSLVVFIADKKSHCPSSIKLNSFFHKMNCLKFKGLSTELRIYLLVFQFSFHLDFVRPQRMFCLMGLIFPEWHLKKITCFFFFFAKILFFMEKKEEFSIFRTWIRLNVTFLCRYRLCIYSCVLKRKDIWNKKSQKTLNLGLNTTIKIYFESVWKKFLMSGQWKKGKKKRH